MGMKASSNHFASNKTGGGVSKREGKFTFKLNIQAFASNTPDSRMSAKGKALYNADKDQTLKNQIAELYRPGAKIGDGGTADALRHEIETGELVGGKSHYRKAVERSVALQRIIDSGRLDNSDRDIAKSILSDLKNALKGWKK